MASSVPWEANTGIPYLLAKTPHPGDVVAVLVGDEDALHRQGVYAAALEHAVQLAGAAARVDEQPRAAGAYVIAVSRPLPENSGQSSWPRPIPSFPQNKRAAASPAAAPGLSSICCQPIFPITCSGSWLR